MNPYLHPRLIGGTEPSSRRPRPIGYAKVWQRILLARGRIRTRLRQHALQPRLEPAAASEALPEEGPAPCPATRETPLNEPGRPHV